MLGVGDIFIIFFYFIAFLYIRTVNTEYLSKEISHEISFYLTGQKNNKNYVSRRKGFEKCSNYQFSGLST